MSAHLISTRGHYARRKYIPSGPRGPPPVGGRMIDQAGPGGRATAPSKDSGTPQRRSPTLSLTARLPVTHSLGIIVGATARFMPHSRRSQSSAAQPEITENRPRIIPADGQTKGGVAQMPQSRNTTILEPPWLSTTLKIQPDFADLVLTNPVLTGDFVNHGSCRRSPAAPLH